MSGAVDPTRSQPAKTGLDALLAEAAGDYHATAAKRARTLREFDNVVTAPLHGFPDTDHYWSNSSSKPWLLAIRVPTLLLNARNDPFLPGEALPSAHEVSSFVERDFPETGGHVGFVSGAFPGDFRWFRRRIMSFSAHLASRPSNPSS